MLRMGTSRYAKGPNVVEGIMSDRDIAWQERRLDEVLYTDLDPVSKVQQIIRLGFSEDTANDLVERHQLGLNNLVYYERLDFIDDDNEDEIKHKGTVDYFAE